MKYETPDQNSDPGRLNPNAFAEAGYTNPESVSSEPDSLVISGLTKAKKIVTELWTIAKNADPSDQARGL